MQIKCNVCGKIHNRKNPAPYGRLTCRGCGAIGEALDYYATRWHFMAVTPSNKTSSGRLKLVRVFDESEVEEVAVGEYRVKSAAANATVSRHEAQ